jgi:hypothetical protein
MKIKQFLLVLMTSLFVNELLAQEFTPDSVSTKQTLIYTNPYTKAFGVKMYPGALSYKQFKHSNKAIEAIGYVALDGLNISLLKEFYNPIEDADQLSWYYGYGGHLGIWSDEWKKTNDKLGNSNISVGFDGIIGLDYKIKNAPFDVSIDWQPSFSIIQSYFKNQGGIGIRYTF